MKMKYDFPYIASTELESVLTVARKLKIPLLVTGEPGTGKTQLAHYLANKLAIEAPDKFRNRLFKFDTKTTSSASDLFYNYDAIKHFYDANFHKLSDCNKSLNIYDYISLQALGKAIALTNKKNESCKKLLDDSDFTFDSSVVLIDEIDKAPRDFPNDILNEIEQFEFTIKETGETIKKGDGEIIIIMTSNSERNLPDAFLRRCLFYNIPFPTNDDLEKIIGVHLKPINNLELLIEVFSNIRELATNKKPATAELITWLKILELNNCMLDKDMDINDFVNKLSESQQKILKISLSALLKTTDDYKRVMNWLKFNNG